MALAVWNCGQAFVKVETASVKEDLQKRFRQLKRVVNHCVLVGLFGSQGLAPTLWILGPSQTRAFVVVD